MLSRSDTAVAVLRFSRPDRRSPAPPKAAHRSHTLRSARVLLLSALLTILVAPPVLAQIDNWGGDVLVSDDSILVAPGRSVTYSVRLDRIPVHTDGTALVNETVEWFVMVYFDVVEYTDGKYKDLTLVPSFYRTFTGKHNPNNAADDGDWDDWKDFRIHRASYGEWEGQGKQTSDRATSVKLTHEVWDHNANCPVHESKPVTVGVGSEPVAPTVSISDANGVEGGVLRFRVTLSRTSSTLVTVDYETADRTALQGTDYDAASGTLTFGPGTIERTFEVQTREDTSDEPNETFTVTLSDPGGATLGDADAVGTIFDDDATMLPPVLLISDASAFEGEVLSFQVTLNRTSSTLVTVDYETADRTALEGTDYDAASGTLTFGPGTMERTLEVQTREDTADEPNKNLHGDAERPERCDAGGCGRGGDDLRRR